MSRTAHRPCPRWSRVPPFSLRRGRPVENTSAVLRGGLACVCQEDVWVASQAHSPDSAVVSVVERERLVARRRDPNREARHDGVEHFVPLPLRLQQIKISSGQVDGRHGSALPMFPAQEVVWGEPGVTPRRRFDAATRNHSHRALTSNPSTGRELRPNRRMQKIAGKRVIYGLGAGGRWFESSRPDQITQVHSGHMGDSLFRGHR
jgi:hypothetical protein